jgi:D-glycero-alpha-D-manno-heptose 1-phosphate guanylyltransferase
MREAIILAGGAGTRLKSIVTDLPKPLALVNGRPFVEYILDKLVANGFSKIIFSVGYMSHKFLEIIGNSYRNIPIKYVYEDLPLGTGGGIKKCLSALESNCALVINGDTFIDGDYLEMYDIKKKYGGLIIGVKKVVDTSRYGAIEVSNGRVVGFLEKNQSSTGFINVGCYLLDRNVLDAFKLDTCFSFEVDYLQNVYHDLSINICEYTGKFIDIGVPKDYLRAGEYLKFVNF